MTGAVIARDADLPQRPHGGAPEAATTRRWTARRARRLGLLAGAALVLAGAAWYGADWWRTGRFIETTDDAYVGGDVTPIAPHVAGFVAQVLVADNRAVRAGDVLIRLDDRDQRAAADRAQAVLAGREAALDAMQAQTVLQDATVRQDQAELAARDAQARFAVLDAARYDRLAATAAGSRQDAQRAAASDREAQAAAAAAAAALDAARQQRVVLAAQMAGARAGVAAAQAERRTARLDLGYTVIRAPVDGYVGNRAAQAGSFVPQGTYLLSVVPAAGLWVDANFKEDQLARMRPGQTATITADAAPGQVLHGHVLSLAPATGAVFSVIPPENATGNFTKIVQRVPVRIGLDGGAAMLGAIRPGLSVTARVDTQADARRGAPVP